MPGSASGNRKINHLRGKHKSRPQPHERHFSTRKRPAHTPRGHSQPAQRQRASQQEGLSIEKAIGYVHRVLL
jgi:hypothetical protein